MISIQDFRDLCVNSDVDTIVDDVLLLDDALHVPKSDRKHITSKLANAFNVSTDDISIWIVGSAKLGFSINDKPKLNLKKYRPFGPLSDVDIAVVSPKIFSSIWSELCSHAHSFPRMPWDSKSLGDYLIYGWLRPDHFPKTRIAACDDWWDIFNRLSREPRFGRRKVRGGLFYSREDLRKYLKRSVMQCITQETLNHEDRTNQQKG